MRRRTPTSRRRGRCRAGRTIERGAHRYGSNPCRCCPCDESRSFIRLRRRLSRVESVLTSRSIRRGCVAIARSSAMLRDDGPRQTLGTATELTGRVSARARRAQVARSPLRDSPRFATLDRRQLWSASWTPTPHGHTKLEGLVHTVVGVGLGDGLAFDRERWMRAVANARWGGPARRGDREVGWIDDRRPIDRWRARDAGRVVGRSGSDARRRAS